MPPDRNISSASGCLNRFNWSLQCFLKAGLTIAWLSVLVVWNASSYIISYLSALGITWSGIASIGDDSHRRMHRRSHLSLRCQSIGNTPCDDIPVSVHHHTRPINIHPFSIFTFKLGITLYFVSLLLCIVTGIFHGDFLSIGLGIPVHLILKQLKKISNLANQHWLTDMSIGHCQLPGQMGALNGIWNCHVPGRGWWRGVVEVEKKQLLYVICNLFHNGNIGFTASWKGIHAVCGIYRGEVESMRWKEERTWYCHMFNMRLEWNQFDTLGKATWP